MVELEDVDLIKVLDMLSQRAARVARDIFQELASPEQEDEVYELLEQATRLMAQRASRRTPTVIDFSEEWEQRMTGHPVEHSDEDAEVRRQQAEAAREAREARTQQEPDGGE